MFKVEACKFTNASVIYSSQSVALGEAGDMVFNEAEGIFRFLSGLVSPWGGADHEVYTK